MVYIYVLVLQNDKYYVGKTNNPDFRFQKHFNFNGSEWTKKYNPINLFELIPDQDDFDEDKITLKYMNTYGIDNVRGGRYCRLTLSSDEIKYINDSFASANNKCYNCGLSGHFAKKCTLAKPDTTKPEIFVELAKSNRSKCCICESNIDINVRRIGVLGNSLHGKKTTHWHHCDCFISNNFPDFNDNVIELAKSNKSKCYICKSGIDIDVYRIGTLTDSRYGIITRWHHINCAFSNYIYDKKTINCNIPCMSRHEDVYVSIHGMYKKCIIQICDSMDGNISHAQTYIKGPDNSNMGGITSLSRNNEPFSVSLQKAHDLIDKLLG